jgi:hypothetical protein
MQQCVCTTTQHDNHPGEPCDKQATTDDGYCRECHAKAVREHADTKPDMLSYQARSAADSDRQSEAHLPRKLKRDPAPGDSRDASSAEKQYHLTCGQVEDRD